MLVILVLGAFSSHLSVSGANRALTILNFGYDVDHSSVRYVAMISFSVMR